MTAELISVGTELLRGNIVDSNARFLAEECAMLGFDLFYRVTVGDNYDRLMSVVRQALSRSDILILTGGLGPREDGLTKEVCADAFDMPLVEDVHTQAHLTEFFRNHICREIPDNNRKMAAVPRGAQVIDNTNGMMPGLILEKDGKTAILLPGSPGELYPMFYSRILPYLRQKQNPALVSGMMNIRGYGKSRAKDVTLEAAVAELLRKKHLTMCTAESCTGGMIAARMVNVPGVSQVFTEGMVTYSNEAKTRLLGVREETLAAHGAVSEETAREMAEGGARAAGAALCVSTTGIAGPDGGTKEKPVGLVYMACCLRGRTTVRKYQFSGNRETVREQAMMKALDLVQHCIDSGC